MAMLDGLKNYFARKAREDAIMATGGQLTADQYALLTPEQQKALRMQRYSSVRNNISQADLAINYQTQQENNMLLEQQRMQKDAMDRYKANPNKTLSKADIMTILGPKEYLAATMRGNDGSTLITNANFLNKLRTELRKETDLNKRANLEQQINDVMGLGSVGKYDPKITFDKKRAETLATQGLNFGERPMNKGEISTDEKFATIYTKYIDDGRGAKNIANLEKLGDAKLILKAAAQNGVAVSGVTAGMLSGFPKLSAYFNEQGLMVEERIASVIQQSLKEILGGQFSEKEGEALIRRGYNPNLSPEENLERLLDLYAQSEQLIETEKESVYHWENNNNSMRGYKGKTYTQESFIRDLSKDYLLDAKDLDSIEIEDAYKKAKEYSLWESVLEKEILRRTGR